MTCALGVDPGTGKCGLALVALSEAGHIVVLWRVVCPTSHLEQFIAEAKEVFPFDKVAVGSGTSSKPLISRIAAAVQPIKPQTVDEANTTLLARELYWKYNPRRGWRKFVPLSLQVPPEPYDDFAAVILAERAIRTE